MLLHKMTRRYFGGSHYCAIMMIIDSVIRFEFFIIEKKYLNVNCSVKMVKIFFMMFDIKGIGRVLARYVTGIRLIPFEVGALIFLS